MILRWGRGVITRKPPFADNMRLVMQSNAKDTN